MREILFSIIKGGERVGENIQSLNSNIVGKQLIKKRNEKDGRTHRANEKGDNQQTNESKKENRPQLL